MEEVWKDINGYDGYQASNLGRIRTHNKITYTQIHGKRCWKDRIIKPKISKKDRCSRVELWKNGKHKTFLVHRLIADTFLENNLENDLTVNHKDGNRFNNNVENLEWVTRADNIRLAFDTGLYNTSKKTIIIDKISGDTRTYRSMSEASKAIGVNKCYISLQIKRGKYENDKYKWDILK